MEPTNTEPATTDNTTDNGVFVPNEDTATENQPNHPLAQDFPCPKCPKSFASAPALRMHDVRTHSGRGWNTSKNFKNSKRKTGKKWTPEQRRNFSATLQARNQEKKSPGLAQSTQSNPGVTFCPRCGCNIKIVAAALSFGDRQ